DVQEHIRPAVVGDDETVALGGVEPFDDAGDFDEVGGGVAKARKCIEGGVARCTALKFRRLSKPVGSRPAWRSTELLGLKSVRPHDPGPHTQLTVRPSKLHRNAHPSMTTHDNAARIFSDQR